jgi:two-component system cell cycle sensor histidine kinase/response regulator CckA
LDVLFVESDVAFINRLIPELNGNQSSDHSRYLNIVTAQCLRDAIDALETRKFDVIVTDIGLSDACGMLVLEELIEFGQNTPIIVLTNISRWSEVIGTAQPLVRDFLMKNDLDHTQLLNAIHHSAERNKLEEKSSHFEAEFTSLVNMLPLGLCILSVDGTCRSANQKFAEMIQLPAESIKGKMLNSILKEDIFKPFQDALSAAFSTRESIEFTLGVDNAGENPKEFLVQASAVLEKNGEVKEIMMVSTDITKQKAAQRENGKTEGLNDLKHGLPELVKELNNAMGTILLDVENLRRTSNLDAVQKIANRIEESVKEERSILRPYLACNLQVDQRIESFDSRKFFLDLASEFKQNLPDHIFFEANIAEHLQSIKGDSSKLAKIILHLFNNASESMPEKGIVKFSVDQVEMKEKDEALTNLDLHPGPYLKLEISDEGCGIPVRLRERVFEPLCTTKGESHKGIGLSDASQIVKDHRGNLRILDNPPKGTLVQIFLPTSFPKHQPIQDLSTSSPPKKKTKTILLVDDEENFRLAADQLLDFLGYETILATNGAEALSTYNQRRSEIDLVITDNSMPVMDGHDLIKALRQLSPTLKIIPVQWARSRN